VTAIISFCFVIGLAASAIAGAAIFVTAGMQFLGACFESAGRSLTPAVLDRSAAGEDYGRPRARIG